MAVQALREPHRRRLAAAGLAVEQEHARHVAVDGGDVVVEPAHDGDVHDAEERWHPVVVEAVRQQQREEHVGDLLAQVLGHDERPRHAVGGERWVFFSWPKWQSGNSRCSSSECDTGANLPSVHRMPQLAYMMTPLTPAP
jgi:hypothetical protein